MIEDVQDLRRRTYLKEIFESLTYQLNALNDPNISYTDFSRHAFGFEIKRVTEIELRQLETTIKKLEEKMGQTRQEVFNQQKTQVNMLLEAFKRYIQEAKDLLPLFITDFPDSGFSLDLVNNKPWSAFNSHISPFSSKLSINTDVDLSDPDLYHLAFHEAYGGHHSELSQKDKLLLGGRGEHGLVITFSPQTFISEAIAEGIFSIYQSKQSDPTHQMVWNYNRLIFALQNLATYLFFDDKKSREQINRQLKEYTVSKKTRENILNFSTDKLFGRYAPVYYTAYDFFTNLYEGAKKKDELVKTLFTLPCTPSLLLKEFATSK